jgi:hypothetical protein
MRAWLIALFLPTVHAAALASQEPDHEVLRRLDGTEGGRRLDRAREDAWAGPHGVSKGGCLQ